MPKRSRLARKGSQKLGKWARLKEAIRREPIGSDVFIGLGGGIASVGAMFPAAGMWAMIPVGAVFSGMGALMWKGEKIDTNQRADFEDKLRSMSKKERKEFVEHLFKKKYGMTIAESKKLVWKPSMG